MRVFLLFIATLAWAQPGSVDYPSQVKRPPAFDSRSFEFTRTNGSGLSGSLAVVGNNVLTLTRAPLGVNGTNTYHHVYVSGGTGTAEAALIVGGTCTSGAANCTLVINTANAHTGAWTIISATGGIQEAYWTIPASGGGTISVPAGTINTYATITLLHGRKVALVGQGREATVLASQDATSANAIDLLGTSLSSGSNNEIRNLQITCVADKTQGYGIGLEYQTYSKISDSTIIGCPSGIHWGQTINQGRIINVAIREMENATGMGILMDGAASFANVVSEVVSDTSGQPLAGIRIRFTGDVVIQNSHFIHCSYGMLIDPPVLPAAVNSVEVINTYLDNNVTAGLLIQPIGEVARIRFLNSWASSGAGVGILLSLAGGGTIDGVSFEQMHVFGNGLQGMLVNGGGSISVNNSWFSSNGTSAPGTLPGIAIAANVSNWRIENNRSGPSSGFTSNTQSYGLDISAGTSTNWVVAGNDFTGNATASFRDLSTGTTKRLSGNIPFQMDDGGTIASASTMTISPAGSFYHVSGTTNIDNINTCNASNASRTITLVFLDTLTVNDGGNLSLAGNVSATAGDSLVLVCEGTLWVELSRSNNF